MPRKTDDRRNDPLLTVVRAARGGSVLAARGALFLVGRALMRDEPLDPIVRKYISRKLIEAANVATKRYDKSEYRAMAICKALGLVGRSRQRPKSLDSIAEELTGRPFHKFSDDRIAGLVLLHQERNNVPLTGEDGAFAKVSRILGKKGFSPGTVKSIYYRVRKLRNLPDPDARERLMSIASKHEKAVRLARKWRRKR